TLGQAMTSSKGGPQIPKRSMISSSYSNETKKGQIFWLLGDTFTGGETDGKYPVSEISSPPRGGPPLHSHTKESEGFYVIGGEFLFQYGDDKTVAKRGAFLHQKVGIPHTCKNIGNSTGRLLSTIIPDQVSCLILSIHYEEGIYQISLHDFQVTSYYCTIGDLLCRNFRPASL